MTSSIFNLVGDSSKIQSNLSRKFFSNSTIESIHRSNFFENVGEISSEMISRRLKVNRHPLSGMRSLLPEMSNQFASHFDAEEDRSSNKLNARILETWINNTIFDAESLSLPNNVVKNEAKLPLMRFGIDRTSLLKVGLQTSDVDRLYRSLFVYSIGFYQLIQKTLEHTKERKYNIVTGIWKVYAILLEYCCQLDYKMIIETLKLEKEEELDQMKSEYQLQIGKLENNEKHMIETINAAKAQLALMQKELQVEIVKREEVEDELLRRGSGHEEEVTMRLQFESKLNQMYAKMRDLQTKIELLTEDFSQVQKDLVAQTENLQKERNKNIHVSKMRNEMEFEMRKTEEKFKQIELININLDRRLNDCYNQIEALNINLSNLNTTYSETMNELSQKNIEVDNLNHSLSLVNGKMTKLQAVLVEVEKEKEIQQGRIADLETTLVNEREENNFYKQGYVKVKESDAVNSVELAKYKDRSEKQENVLTTLLGEKNSLAIRLDASETLVAELKTNVKDLQVKLEEMNKGRRTVEEHNESLKVKLEDRVKEVHDCRKTISGLRDEQERYKNRESELELELSETKIKYQSSQKQFETVKQTLKEKINNLQEILESEKKMREMWVQKYEDEIKAHAVDTKELLSVQDKLSEITIKANTLAASLEESNFSKEKLSESYKDHLEEILVLKFQNEEYFRKNKTLQLLVENFDHEYKLRENELVKEHEEIKDELQRQVNVYRMESEDFLQTAAINYEKICELSVNNKGLSRKLETKENFIAGLEQKLEKKNERVEGCSMMLEDARIFILSQFSKLHDSEASGKKLENELEKTKKHFIDFRNLAPQELRNAPNPFRILTKQIEDLKSKIDYIESIKIEYKDFQGQWDAPLPDTEEIETQTDPVVFETPLKKHAKKPRREKNEDENLTENSAIITEESLKDDFHAERKNSLKNDSYYGSSRHSSLKRESSKISSSGSSKHNTHGSLRKQKGGKIREVKELKYIGGEEESKNDEVDFETHQSNYDERATPLNLKSMYAKEKNQVFEDAAKSPAKLPVIVNKRNLQASPSVYTPTPIPVLPSTDFKRALKQANSRRKND